MGYAENLVVWKYDVRPGGNELLLPFGARVLSFQSQRGSLCFWALVDPKLSRMDRTFHVTGTGHEDINPDWIYHGTAQQEPFVWHLFEEEE